MIKIPKEINLEDYILILPSVGVGNVGQLSIDLLIYNLNLCKTGSMWNSMFLPISGLDPYNKDSSSICTAADFYLATSCKIICLQLRSPYVDNSNDFFEELAQFVQNRKISKVIVLTSSYDYECANGIDSTLRYLTSDVSLLNNEQLLESLAWKQHVKGTSIESAECSRIPGGGFASNLYEHLKSEDIVCTILYCYCSEGNNVSDALLLYKGLNKWLNLLNDSAINDVKYPPSWEYFFGNPPSTELY
ncbi:proteasome assembly chaperone 2 [Osmia lignaria lignaria]|uniref:proteasome assembly chaperone 2 n=1 Tax=Osmia lignaria lignaria TaxID=1437193 RepID=UPI00402B7E44